MERGGAQRVGQASSHEDRYSLGPGALCLVQLSLTGESRVRRAKKSLL